MRDGQILCDLVNRFFPFAQTPAIHRRYIGIGDSSSYSFIENIQFFITFMIDSLHISSDLLFDANDLYALDTLSTPTSDTIRRNILLSISLFAGYIDAHHHGAMMSSSSSTTSSSSSVSKSNNLAPPEWKEHRGIFSISPGDGNISHNYLFYFCNNFFFRERLKSKQSYYYVLELLFAISSGSNDVANLMLTKHDESIRLRNIASLSSHGWTPIYTGYWTLLLLFVC